MVTLDNMNQNLKGMDFPWPSLVVARGNELEMEVKLGGFFPYPDVIHAHAGDPQGYGQKPLTFFKQVLALCLSPELLNDDSFPQDAKQRAKVILANCRGFNAGAYSESQGLEAVRRQVARYIEQRDGIPSNYEDIFLSGGCTDGVRALLSILNYSTTGKPAGVMIPIPQYPLFSSTVAEYGMYQISYYLDEENSWALNVSEMKRAIEAAKPHCDPRVLVIINPGNPSGFVMSRKDMEEIVKFAYEEKLFVIADEVYQFNVYTDDQEFISFKKVITEMGPPYSGMELASFMSASKGYMGECGARGGYSELVNIVPEVKEVLWRYLSSKHCPPITGQIVIYCITNQPQPGEPSYEQFHKERKAILQSLKERADLVSKTFNALEGLHCNKIIGAMYAYPRIDIPLKAIEEAEEIGIQPDELYTLQMLESVGVCLIPGNQFGQRPGTYHFRMTFLPQMDKLKILLERIKSFHTEFMKKYK